MYLQTKEINLESLKEQKNKDNKIKERKIGSIKLENNKKAIKIKNNKIEQIPLNKKIKNFERDYEKEEEHNIKKRRQNNLSQKSYFDTINFSNPNDF